MSNLGHVVAIHIAQGARLPMKSVESVVAEEGKGLVGDRYHGTRHRHVSVQSLGELQAASEAFGNCIDAGHTRRNITVSQGHIPSSPGDRVRLGDVELEVVRIAAPCTLLDDVIGRGAKVALRRKAGSIFRVLSSGEIRIGDPAELHDDEREPSTPRER